MKKYFARGRIYPDKIKLTGDVLSEDEVSDDVYAAVNDGGWGGIEIYEYN